MSKTIGLVANVYNEANALPGWLETHLPFFDDVRVVHAGPSGLRSEDGTIEILEKWCIPIKYLAIDLGFGIVRTEAVRWSPCDFVMILDADERFYPLHRRMRCSGESTPHNERDEILQGYDFRDGKCAMSNWENLGRLGANLTVEHGDVYDQGTRLRAIINEPNIDGVVTIRRHWHDLSLRRPTQNWHTDPDWQIRIVRNDTSITYDHVRMMHEQLLGCHNRVHADFDTGPFFDHFHFTFKRMEPQQRAHDVAIYDAIHEGRRPPTWAEFIEGRSR